MPRLSRLRVPALLELAEQLRYAPRAATERQITRVEELALELDPSLTYPEDFIVFRITGYRPEMADPRMIVGEALLSDLSALAERLSEHAQMPLSDMGEVLTIDGLTERWSVTRRTLERWRRRGLIARRVRDEKGAVRIVFRAEVVRAFEAGNGGIVQKASSFTRLTEEDRRRALVWARGYRARLGWTRHAAAGRIAWRLGRSRETIRALLESHDAAAPEPLFEEAGPLTPRQRRAIERMDRWGIAPGAMASHFSRSRATVHRVIDERRAERLSRLDLSGPADGHPWDGQQVQLLLEEPAVQGCGWVDPIVDVGLLVEQADADPPTPPQIEHARSEAMVWLLRRAREGCAALDARSISSTALDRVETDLRWMTHLKGALVQSQRGLIVRTVRERLGGDMDRWDGLELASVLDACFEATVLAVGRHDPIKGGRVAAPVSLALNRLLAGVAMAPPMKARRRDAPRPTLADWSRGLTPWQEWLAPPEPLRAHMEDLDADVRAVALARYGLGGQPPRTIAEIEVLHGVAPGRAATLLRTAVREARRVAGEASVL
jgi:RNA polymerase primary sigma factor